MKKIDVAHVVGNGSTASFFSEKSKGLRMACNLPPFTIRNVYAYFIVDFKMMRAMAEGSVTVPGRWILGYRPKLYLNQNPAFHMKNAPKILDYYMKLPDYAGNFTNWNCGHMATHYTASKFSPKEIHMYGFNSMFDFDLYSVTDFYLQSDRSNTNSSRLSNKWREIWPHLFAEFPQTKFVLHYKHDDIKFDVPDNVEIVVHELKKKKAG